jgi:diaminobutyrate-2-oxoglutarate transaminase
MFRGLSFPDPEVAARASRRAFELGVLVETSGARGQVLKLMPPITIDPAALHTGLDLIAEAITA